jgi:hypothetical protein
MGQFCKLTPRTNHTANKGLGHIRQGQILWEVLKAIKWGFQALWKTSQPPPPFKKNQPPQIRLSRGMIAVGPFNGGSHGNVYNGRKQEMDMMSMGDQFPQ